MFREGYAEKYMSVPQVTLAIRLPFGEGLIGTNQKFENEFEESQFADGLKSYVKPITIGNTADCVDDRPIVALANGVNLAENLEERVTYQLAGGLGLATTKAAIGADASYLKDSGSFKDAYIKTVDLLTQLGYREAAHAGCGASAGVEKSVANGIPENELVKALPALTEVNDQTSYYLNRNQQTKKQRLDDGFYGDWDPNWHESFVADNFPDNFSFLADDPEDHLTHGHRASGLLIIQNDGYGFAKTEFTNNTDKMVFATTPNMQIISDLVYKLSGSDEEKARMTLEFGVDPAHVLNVLATKGLPAFVTAA